ncbi:MAG: hypothetical protein OXC46_00285 [Thaumarchaeota archaeon]|nr:hypothetical protein [Nitrososphaerota archaeon]
MLFTFFGCIVIHQIRSLDGQKLSEFTVSVIPNNASMTSYYTAKHILKMLNNPKTP